MLLDSKTGKLWSQENVNLKLQDMRKRAIADLRKRDVARGVPANGVVYHDGEPGRFEVDVELSRKKHTGRDVRLLTHGRWAKYCSQPRDEVGDTKSMILDQHQRTVGKHVAAAKGIEASLSVDVASQTTTAGGSVTTTVAPKKRGPGRPRKSESL